MTRWKTPHGSGGHLRQFAVSRGLEGVRVLGYSGPNAPNAFRASSFLPSPWCHHPRHRCRGSWPSGRCPTPGESQRPAAQLAACTRRPGMGRPGPRFCPLSPPRARGPERLPFPDPRPCPRPHSSGRVHAFPRSPEHVLGAPDLHRRSRRPEARARRSAGCCALP